MCHRHPLCTLSVLLMPVASLAQPATASIFTEQSNHLEAWITGLPVDEDGSPQTQSILCTNTQPGSFLAAKQFDTAIGAADVGQSLTLTEDLGLGSVVVAAAGTSHMTTGPTVGEDPQSPFFTYDAAGYNNFSLRFDLPHAATVRLVFAGDFTGTDGDLFATLTDSGGGSLWHVDSTMGGLPQAARLALAPGRYDLAAGVTHGLVMGHGDSDGFFDLSLTVAPDPLGDMNLDGALDAADVAPFVLALTDPQAYDAQHGIDPALAGDINLDGLVDATDVAPFVQMLVGAGAAGAGGGGGAVAMPEPGAIVIVALGALMLPLRRPHAPRGRLSSR
ncbi:MAG: hypothetical protein WD009_08925 [Phycisphaeraceae bacterium]